MEQGSGESTTHQLSSDQNPPKGNPEAKKTRRGVLYLAERGIARRILSDIGLETHPYLVLNEDQKSGRFAGLPNPGVSQFTIRCGQPINDL